LPDPSVDCGAPPGARDASGACGSGLDGTAVDDGNGVQVWFFFSWAINRREWYYKCTTFPPSCKRFSDQNGKKHEKFFPARKNREKDRPELRFPLDEPPPEM